MPFTRSLMFTSLCLAIAACQAPQTPAPAQPAPTEAHRIVSMVPSFTEILYAVGAQDRLVGVSMYSDYPPEARELPHVGGYHDPSYEAIVALKPDLVLLSDYREETIARLGTFNIKVHSMPHKTLADIYNTVREVSALAGEAEAGATLATFLETRVNDVRAKTRNLPRQRVLLSVGRDISNPTMREIYAAGPKGFLNELLEAAGGTNAIEAGGPVDYPVLTAESILALRPDRVFEILAATDQPKVDDGTVLAGWKSLPNFDLDENGRVNVFCNDYTNIPGPRIEKILDDFVSVLHPELTKATP